MPTTATPPPTFGRSPRRLGIEPHTEFVASLMAELQSAVARLQAASGRLDWRDGAEEAPELDLAAEDDLDRQTADIVRLVCLLDAVDGVVVPRRREVLSLPAIVSEAAEHLGLDVSVAGQAGLGLFSGDATGVPVGLDLVLLALAGGGAPVRVRFAGDCLVIIEGTMDFSDPSRSWQLRYGRRVLESEGCGVHLFARPDGCHVELRIRDR